MDDYNAVSPCACLANKADMDGYCWLCRAREMRDELRCNKHRFTKKSAQIALVKALLRAQRAKYQHRQECRVYLCECGHWHLTSQPERGEG